MPTRLATRAAVETTRAATYLFLGVAPATLTACSLIPRTADQPTPVDRTRAFSLPPDTAGGRAPAAETEDAASADGDTVEGRGRDTVPEQIPGYRDLERYLRSLRPVEGARPGAGEGDETGLSLDLIVNETRTPTGQDFFDEFYGAWEPPEGVSAYTIRVKEEPVLGLYTRVLLELDGEQLFQLPLQPRHEYVQSVARQAASYVRQVLADRSGGVSGG